MFLTKWISSLWFRKLVAIFLWNLRKIFDINLLFQWIVKLFWLFVELENLELLECLNWLAWLRCVKWCDQGIGHGIKQSDILSSIFSSWRELKTIVLKCSSKVFGWMRMSFMQLQFVNGFLGYCLKIRNPNVISRAAWLRIRSDRLWLRMRFF